jgi:DNA-binding SARP family transcriptional activator
VDSPPAARVNLLNGFAVQLGGRGAGREVGDLPHGAQRLVAHLGLAGQRARSSVAGSLWPDVPEAQAHGSLRSTLWRIHKIAPGLIASRGGSLALAQGVDVDVHELDRWARRAVDRSVDIDDVRVRDANLRGDLLPGWYDDWVLLERERLRQLRMHTLEVVATRLSAAGRHGEAVEAAYAAIEAEPLRESAHRVLVRIHLAEGNVVEALRVFERFRALMTDELGVSPTRQMTDLVHGLCPGAHAPERDRIHAGP